MSLVEQLSTALRKRGWKLTSAESCTGGMISAAITDLPGSSDIFDRGFITYSNQAKTDLLGVYSTILETHGAVSEQTAKAMAEGAMRQAISDIAVSVTGIAGPGGGSPEKPVGLVFIGVCIKDRHPIAFRHEFKGTRAEIREQTVQTAFARMLELMGEPIA